MEIRKGGQKGSKTEIISNTKYAYSEEIFSEKYEGNVFEFTLKYFSSPAEIFYVENISAKNLLPINAQEKEKIGQFILEKLSSKAKESGYTIIVINTEFPWEVGKQGVKKDQGLIRGIYAKYGFKTFYDSYNSPLLYKKIDNSDLNKNIDFKKNISSEYNLVRFFFEDIGNIIFEEEKFPMYDFFDKCQKESDEGNFSPEIVKNERGEILAPNKKLANIQVENLQKIIRTPTFINWFGDWTSESFVAGEVSEVRYHDTNEPLMVFHGLEESIRGRNQFKEELYIKNGPHMMGENLSAPHLSDILYFTSKDLHAKFWSTFFDIHSKKPEDLGNKEIVFPAFLNIRKPRIYKSHHELTEDFFIENNVIRQNNDGAIQWSGPIHSKLLDSDQFAIFKREQAMFLPIRISSGGEIERLSVD